MISFDMAFQSGFVAVVGRPNVGKSTLVNHLAGSKVAIVTPRPQTTRNRIQGIVTRENAQVVLVDTPGIHKPATALGRQMMAEVEEALDGIDVVALLLDSTERLGRADHFVFERVRRFQGPKILLLNKIDLIPKARLLPLMDACSREENFAEIIPISARTGDGLPVLWKKLVEHLPQGEPYFPAEQITDQPERFLAGEIIREKAMSETYQEVPHAIAALVDEFEESARLIRIRAVLYVEREGQKGILIGKAGETLKDIGSAAREELEKLLGIRIFLELRVKVHLNWRDSPAFVRRLDWRRQLEHLADQQTVREGDS